MLPVHAHRWSAGSAYRAAGRTVLLPNESGRISGGARARRARRVPTPIGDDGIEQMSSKSPTTRLLVNHSGIRIRLTAERLAHVLKHPEMAGLAEEIGVTLRHPAQVIRSRGQVALRSRQSASGGPVRDHRIPYQ